MNYYSYNELKKAVDSAPTQANIDNLGEWFSQFGNAYWNGEVYDAGDICIKPVYKETAEDEFEIVGYEIV